MGWRSAGSCGSGESQYYHEPAGYRYADEDEQCRHREPARHHDADDEQRRHRERQGSAP
jgi:hypothetical protein